MVLAGCQVLVGIRERSSSGSVGTSGAAGSGAGALSAGGAPAAASGGRGGSGSGGKAGAGGTGSATGGTETSGGTGGTSGACDDPLAGGGEGGALPEDAGDPVHDQALVDVLLEDASCRRTAGSGVSCAARVQSTGGDVDIAWPTWDGGIVCSSATVYAYDDRGNRYRTSSVRFGSKTHADRCGLAVTLVDGVTADLSYDFDDVSDGATEITLLAFRPSVAGVAETVTFRRLPLAGECGGWAPDDAPIGREVDAVTAQGVSIRGYPCRVRSNELECPLVLTSESKDRVVTFPTRYGGISCGGGTASAFDDQGNELVATRVDVANETKTAPCDFARLLVRAVPTLVRYRFGPVDDAAESVSQVRLTGFGVDGVAEDVRLSGLPLER